MLPVLQIGPLALPLPALIPLIAFWIGLEIAERQASLFGASPDSINNTSLVAVLAGLVGARLGYAARSPEAFLASPLSLLALNPQMMDPTGGLIAALLAALLYIKIQRLDLWRTLDAMTGLFSILAVSIGLSHFASGDAFGAPAQVPWAIDLWGETRHPAQVYETLAAVLIAALVWPGRTWALFREIRHPAGAGTGLRFWTFLGLSAAARLFLETFRGDSVLLWNSIREAQGIAWLVLGICLWQIGKRLDSQPAEPERSRV